MGSTTAGRSLGGPDANDEHQRFRSDDTIPIPSVGPGSRYTWGVMIPGGDDNPPSRRLR